MENSSQIVSAVEAHCLSIYPEEACGIVAQAPQAWLHFPLRNTFSGTPAARHSYRFDELELMSCLQEIEKAGAKRVYFYHSHPDQPAEFSFADQQAALFEGRPIYPQIVYWVLSVDSKRVAGHGFFAYEAASACYQRSSELSLIQGSEGLS